MGVTVRGASSDTPEDHVAFREKYKIPFRLLADTDHALATAYGTWTKRSMYGKEFMGIERSTFLVDGAGVVRRAWRGVKVAGHVAEVHVAAQGIR